MTTTATLLDSLTVNSNITISLFWQEADGYNYSKTVDAVFAGSPSNMIWSVRVGNAEHRFFGLRAMQTGSMFPVDAHNRRSEIARA